MTLRQLKYFVEIAQSGSLSRAALRLHIAQPALSQNIASMESALGVLLFERHAKGVDLTEEGRNFFSRAKRMLEELAALEGSVATDAATLAGPVRIFLVGSLAGVVAAPLLAAVAAKHPGIDLLISDGLSSQAKSQIESGASQLALMPGASGLAGCNHLPVLQEQFMFIGAKHLMGKSSRAIAFKQVAKHTLAAPDRAHDLRQVIERVAQATDTALDVRYELNSSALLLSVVRAGLAYAVLPYSACEDAVLSDAVACRPIREPEISRTQSLVWPAARPLAGTTAAVRDALAQVLANLVKAGRLSGHLIKPTHQ